MFVRRCPYFPFSARVCLNQHHWLALRLREEGIDFQQSTNAFLRCGDPGRLQQLADSLSAQDLLRCGQKWLAAFTPFFTPQERHQAGCQHRLFFSQVEYCDNLIFYRRAAVDQLTQRLLDMNRTLGQPKKITMIFGRKVTKQYKGKLQTVIEDLDLPNPVIRTHYGNGFAKQYVRDDRLLRTEPATNNVYDYGVNKDVENLPRLHDRMSAIIDNYQNVQQDILETFVDRGQLRKLAEPTTLANGRRLPGLKLDHPRQLAVMHSLVRLANIAGGGTFTTADLQGPALHALGLTENRYSRASLRYDLSKLRAKGLWSKRFPTPAVIDWRARATRSAWSSSSCSNESTRPLLRASSTHFREIAPWQKRNAANSTACINASPMIWMHSWALLVSRPPHDCPKGEQNSRCQPHNGN